MSTNSNTSSTIAAALSTSQQLGGAPVVVSLPTKTPQKSRENAENANSAELHHLIRDQLASPDPAAAAAAAADRLTDRPRETPRTTTPSKPGSATNTDRLTDRSRGTPRNPTGGLNSTMPTPLSSRSNITSARSNGLSATSELGLTQATGVNSLNHTTPSASALAQAALLSARSGMSREREVTINERENTISSPGPSPNVSSARSPYVPATGPVLKPAGAASAQLDDMQDVNALVRQARMAASPRGLAQGELEKIQQNNEPISQPKSNASAAADARAARAQASYLIKKGALKSRDEDDDRISSSSSNGSRLRETSTSHVARLLSASQEGGWAKNVTKQLGGNGLSGAQEALFLSMRKVLPLGRKSSLSARSSSEAKSSGGGGSSRYDSDEDRANSRAGSPKRPSTAGSLRSSRSGSGSGSTSVSRGSESQKPLKVSSTDMREISNRLTQPVKSHYTRSEKKRDPTLKYLLLEEALECERKPFKSKAWAESTSAATKDEEKDSGFTERMEGQERARRQAMEDRINQENYDLRLDRKECPNCHSKQSYNELKMKIMKCTICNEEFKPFKTWAQVSKKFFERGKGYEEKSKAFHQKLKAAIDSEHVVQAHKFNPKTGKVEVAADAKPTRWDDDLGVEFFTRMEEKLNLREERLGKVDADTFGTVCTFQPKITKRKKKGDDENDDDDDEDEVNAAMQAQAFMIRLDEDMEARRKAHPEKYMPKHKTEDKDKGKMPIWT